MENFSEKPENKYDDKNAILSIYAGAGGTDAQDWAEMLLRMYLRYAKNKNWRAKVLQVRSGKEAGIKSATMEIKAPSAYGVFKGESGVHRLVRISPFSSAKLRHTSFALVEVLPEIEETEVKIRPEDLRIDTYRSSGPGGQYVNVTESAVRLTHMPTGLVAACQAERSQGENKKRALKLLYVKLHQYLSLQKEEERAKLRGEHPSPEWGSQIRSYVLHPYKMVKDHRSGVKVSDPDKVLDGNLEAFVKNP
jgi:peptide chain release factor 2